MIDWATTRDERRVLGATCFGHRMTHLYMRVFPALVIPLRGREGLIHQSQLTALGGSLLPQGTCSARC